MLFTTSSENLRADGYVPIWEVENRGELDALRAVFALYEREPVCVSGAHASLDHSSSEDLVFGVGAAWAARQGKSYAAATGRCFSAGLPSEIASRKPAVVVCDSGSLTSDLLLNIAEVQREHRYVIGIVAAATEQELSLRRLVFSAAGVLRPARRRMRAHVAPGLDSAVQFDGKCMRVGNAADTAAVGDAVAAGASVVTLSGHSNGVDLEMGNNATLCAVKGGVRRGGGAPDCVRRGICHRITRKTGTRTTLAEAMERLDVVAAPLVSARMVVLDTCYGLLPLRASVDRRWSLLAPI